MQSGRIDVLALIGNSKAERLDLARPQAQQVRQVLGLEAKNPAVVFPTQTWAWGEGMRQRRMELNGQRCTALKVIYVHKDIREKFLEAFAKATDNLVMGVPLVDADITLFLRL